MSLDLIIFDEHRMPLSVVALDVELHWASVSIAKNKRLDLFLRLEDYYSESEFSTDELDQLIKEIQCLATEAAQIGSEQSIRVAALMADIEQIAMMARDHNTPIVVAPD